MNPQLVQIIIGLVVIGGVAGVGLFAMKPASAVAEQRLEGLSGAGRRAKADLQGGMLLRPPTIDQGVNGLLQWLPSPDSLPRLYEQADVNFPFRRFLLVPGILAIVGMLLALFGRLPSLLVPVSGLLLGSMPFLWLVMRRKRRMRQFMSQMPDALELMARALRAGHGLASGLNVVAEEMPAPISIEFGRVYEEQNLGIPLEDALRSLSERVPSMDVRFFVTAVVIQRATGGDLGEVLDKIGRLIRERFQIWGQVQALTAEGRLSGIMLMALPPALVAGMFVLNPEYLRPLLETPIGTKMVTIAGVLQLVGAVAIKKIVTIKV